MLFRILIVGFALAFSVPAQAEPDWWWLGIFGEEPDRMSVYVDRNSVQPGEKNSVAVSTLYVKEKPLATNGEVVVQTAQRFHCKSRRLTLMGRKAFSVDGKDVGSGRWDNVPSSQVKPETTADVTMRYVCRKNPPFASGVDDPIRHALVGFGQVDPNSSTEASEEQEVVGTGTGFFVAPTGLLVTSYHVVEGAERIVVYTADGSEHEASVFRSSPATDLAVLKVDYRPSTYLQLATPNSARPGDRVFTFGFPVVQVLGWEPKFTDGAISSLSGFGNEAAFAQISVPVQPGNSGGPLVNERGEVVGVIAAGAAIKSFLETAGTLPQNVNWAVRSEYVAPLIGTTAPDPVRSREEAVARARSSVALVVVQQ